MSIPFKTDSTVTQKRIIKKSNVDSIQDRFNCHTKMIINKYIVNSIQDGFNCHTQNDNKVV